MNELLQAHGYNTIQSIDGMDTIQLSRKHSPDLILMDIQLPRASSIVHTTVLKSKTDLKDIPVLAVSAFAIEGDKERIMEAG